MARLTDPRWLLTKANMLLLFVPAAFGWAWAFNNSVLYWTVAMGVTFGVMMSAMWGAVHTRYGYPGHNLWIKAARMFVLAVDATPAMYTYFYLAAQQPLAWWSIVAFFISQAAFRVVQSIRQSSLDPQPGLA